MGAACSPQVNVPHLDALKSQQAALRHELRYMVQEHLLGGMGSVGFETELRPTHEYKEWVQVEWKEPAPINQIVLVPLIWHVSENGHRAGGFPVEFRVLAGSDAQPDGVEVASFSETDSILPRSTPLVIACDMTATWVRVEASKLSKRIPDDPEELYNLQLSELLVFSGEENVALNQQVAASSFGLLVESRRRMSALTDGYLPYKMHSVGGGEIHSFMSVLEPKSHASIVLDFGTPHPISRVHLHATDSRETAPKDSPIDFGLPGRFVIQAADNANFSDAMTLATRKKKFPYDTGPIMVVHIPECSKRYLRIIFEAEKTISSVIGLSEIEVFSKGKNIAPRAHVLTEGLIASREQSGLETLTNGLNRFGKILTTRDWVNELARRHDLEVELTNVSAQIEKRLAFQKKVVTTLGWSAAVLLVGSILGFMIMQILKMRQLAALRERFAADLHDELGANLHSIDLMTEIAREDLHSPKELEGMLQQIQSLTKSTLVSARHCIQKQTNPLQHNLPEDMRQLSRRILADMEWHLDIEGAEHLSGIKGAFVDDLFLFYKECLINISRHSRAACVNARLEASKRQITLTVTDDGVGLMDRVPPSVQRRAHLLHGRVSLEKPPQGGTTIQLTLRPPRRLFSFNPKKPTEHP